MAFMCGVVVLLDRACSIRYGKAPLDPCSPSPTLETAPSKGM